VASHQQSAPVRSAILPYSSAGGCPADWRGELEVPQNLQRDLAGDLDLRAIGRRRFNDGVLRLSIAAHRKPCSSLVLQALN
jgi:hypothetical protein